MLRYAICIVVGLVIGFLLATMLANALQQRSAWPRGLMRVMQHDFSASRNAARGTQCTTPQMAEAAARLRIVGGQLGPALMPAGDNDRVLAQYVQRFHDAAAKWDTNADCPAQAAALSAIGEACEACHRDYR